MIRFAPNVNTVTVGGLSATPRMGMAQFCGGVARRAACEAPLGINETQDGLIEADRSSPTAFVSALRGRGGITYPTDMGFNIINMYVDKTKPVPAQVDVDVGTVHLPLWRASTTTVLDASFPQYRFVISGAASKSVASTLLMVVLVALFSVV